MPRYALPKMLRRDAQSARCAKNTLRGALPLMARCFCYIMRHDDAEALLMIATLLFFIEPRGYALRVAVSMLTPLMLMLITAMMP